jgi:Cellulase (glycosyl hydrolase family 5)
MDTQRVSAAVFDLLTKVSHATRPPGGAGSAMVGFLANSLSRLGAVVFLAYLIGVPVTRAALPSWVTVNKSNSGFVLSSTGSAFIPWGFNYSRDERFRLIEDYWNDAGSEGWAKIERDFREMRLLGANVVRVNLQFAKFMDAPRKPNAMALARLESLIDLAESMDIYLDITGLGTFRARDVPQWYNNLSERDRWGVQSEFWEAIASAGASHRGVFAYNLMNEPLVSTEHRSTGQWTHPSELEGLRYVEYINLDPAGRTATDIARAWARQLTDAIHQHDRRHAITLGMIWLDGVKPENMPIAPAAIAPEVDFLAVHMYPATGRIDLALEALTHYRIGKPIVVEETFPLHCTSKEYADFLRRSRATASGWLAHFWSLTPDDLRGKTDAPSVLMLESLDSFRVLNPNR